MKTLQMTGFQARQWHNELGGKKFRKQIRRRAIRMGGMEAVQIVDSDDKVVDFIPSDAQAKADGYAVDRDV